MRNFIRIMYCTKPKFPCPGLFRSFHSLPTKTTAATTKSGVERKCGKMGWEERQTYPERDFFAL